MGSLILASKLNEEKKQRRQEHRDWNGAGVNKGTTNAHVCRPFETYRCCARALCLVRFSSWDPPRFRKLSDGCDGPRLSGHVTHRPQHSQALSVEWHMPYRTTSNVERHETAESIHLPESILVGFI